MNRCSCFDGVFFDVDLFDVIGGDFFDEIDDVFDEVGDVVFDEVDENSSSIQNGRTCGGSVERRQAQKLSGLLHRYVSQSQSLTHTLT